MTTLLAYILIPLVTYRLIKVIAEYAAHHMMPPDDD